MVKVASIGFCLAMSCLFAAAYARKLGPAAAAEVEAEGNTFVLAGRDEQVVKLTLYVQDLRIGNKNATVFEVAKASITGTSTTQFGSVHVLDDLVTAGPEFTSKTLGRCQGLTTNADLRVFGIAMNLNFVFTSGRFNGSTLSILGRNQVTDAQRELPLAGGTGAFRFARGYAIQTTYSMDFATSYAVLEYNIYTTYNSKLIAQAHDDRVEIAQM